MTPPVLINTGPSERGFHRVEAFLTCPRKFYWNMKLKEAGITDGGDRFALVRGSIGHAGLAHFYARATYVKLGKDPDHFYSPETAMEMVADLLDPQGNTDGESKALVEAKRAVSFYRSAYAVEDLDVVGIEKRLETKFEGFLYTARADLCVRLGGKVYIFDHKFVGRIEDKTFQRYSLSGQFLGLHHLGRAKWGSEFGGVYINVVGCGTLAVERRAPEPAPWSLDRYPGNVANAERQIQTLTGFGPEHYLAANSEYACFTPYGKCAHFDRCRWGTLQLP